VASITDVLTSLRVSADRLSNAQDSLAAAIERAGDLHGVLVATGVTGSADRVAVLLDRMSRCSARLAAAQQTAAEAIKQASVTRGESGPASNSDHASSAGPAWPSLAPYRAEFFDSLPVRPMVRSPTDGVLTTTDGTKIDNVASGKQGPARGGSGLRLPWAKAESAVEHAEGHAAALMRKRGIRHATLYVNNEPCAGRLGCDRTMPSLLPPGATLTVYGPNGFARRYEGTGEALT
jgi:hypothetical protein